MSNFIEELKRRKVFRVAAVYGVTAWVLIQIADVVLPTFEAPLWINQTLIFLLALGLPLALILAWAYDVGPDGVIREDRGAAAETLRSGSPGSRRRVLYSVFGLLGVAGVILIVFNGSRSPAENQASVGQSVAVLPFVNMSGNADNEYFSDGITEALLNQLAKLSGLRVPARTSSFSFKGQNLPITEIAQILNVAHILEGSVRRAGDRVLITAQLINAETDTHLWSEEFERELDDIFAVQREIALAITDQLRLRLTDAEEQLVDESPTPSTLAYDLYLRGRFAMSVRDSDNLRDAVRFFQQAIEQDPGYAEAYGSLAHTYALLGQSESELLDLAVDTAGQALALDPTLANPHVALGFRFQQLGDLRAAERELRRAVALDSNNADALQDLGRILVWLGEDDEGLAAIARAVALDPATEVHRRWQGDLLRDLGRLDEAVRVFESGVSLGRGVVPLSRLSEIYLILGDRDAALRWRQEALAEALTIAQAPAWALANERFQIGYLEGRGVEELLGIYDEALSTRPDDVDLYRSAAQNAFLLREFDRALEYTDRRRRLAPEAGFTIREGILRMLAGNEVEGRRVLSQRLESRLHQVDSDTNVGFLTEQVMCHAWLGDTEAALDSLERVYQRGMRDLFRLENNPGFDPLRDEPGFQDILARVQEDVDRQRAQIYARTDRL